MSRYLEPRHYDEAEAREQSREELHAAIERGCWPPGELTMQPQRQPERFVRVQEPGGIRVIDRKTEAKSDLFGWQVGLNAFDQLTMRQIRIERWIAEQERQVRS